MMLMSTTSKTTVGDTGAKGADKHPGIVTKGAKAAVGVKAARGLSKHPGMITKAAKVALGVKAAQGVSKRPGVVRLGLKTGKPIARRKVRKRIGQIERFGETAGEVGETVLLCSALIAEGLGLVERPKPRPAAPLFASGLVIGASAVYFFEPEYGRKHRDKLLELAA